MNAQTNNGNSAMVQGRLVWTLGQDLVKGQVKKNMQTKQVMMDQKSGEPIVEYGFGLAIPKVDPRTGQHTAEFTKIWNLLHSEAFTLFPSGQIPPSFAMKFKDGDTAIDEQGRPYSQREGYAGHIVLSCTTRIPIKYFRWEGGNNILVNDGIKNGDYVNVQLNVKAHPAVGQSKAGLYVNPSAVQLIQPGKEIINTPSGDQMFGMGAPVYAGEVIAPVYGQMPQTMAPQAPMAPQGYPQAPVAPQYPQAAPMMPPQAAPVQPNWNVVPPQHHPQAAPVAPAMPPMAPPFPGTYQG